MLRAGIASLFVLGFGCAEPAGVEGRPRDLGHGVDLAAFVITDAAIAAADGATATDLATPPDAATAAPCSGGCTITLVSATVGPQNANGDPWDGAGDLPDDYVNLVRGGTTVRSSQKDNTLAPVWNQILVSGLSAAQLMAGFELQLIDEDSFAPDDRMATWTAVAPTTQQLIDRKMTLTQGTGAQMMTVNLTF